MVVYIAAVALINMAIGFALAILIAKHQHGMPDDIEVTSDVPQAPSGSGASEATKEAEIASEPTATASENKPPVDSLSPMPSVPTEGVLQGEGVAV